MVFNNNESSIVNRTKTLAGNRVINCPKILMEFLSKEPQNYEFVTTNITGTKHTMSSWKRLWESYLCTINAQHGDFSGFKNTSNNKHNPKGNPFVIDAFTPHYLRHTYVTNIIMSGVDLPTAKKQIGHADSKVLLDIYTHISEKHQEEEMQKLNLLISELLP